MVWGVGWGAGWGALLLSQVGGVWCGVGGAQLPPGQWRGSSTPLFPINTTTPSITITPLLLCQGTPMMVH